MATSPLSILQDVAKTGDRRRSVRHKVHSSAYATFSGLSGGMVLDLSEIRDICPEGMSLQLDSAFEVNCCLNIVLDLAETRTYINTTGTVVWTDASGRCGIRFGMMPEASLRQLNSWLLFNTLSKTNDSDAEPGIGDRMETPATRAETPRSLADAPTLNAIRSHVEDLGNKLPAALEFLADRARLLTAASGAAVALGKGEEMVCQASAGEAPGIGARFKVGSGFSGECVRTAKMQRCDDAETNPLVDRESCRALGIRSMVAVPLLTSGMVVGLLEVFSPQAYAFEESDLVALDRLAEIIIQAIPTPPSRQTEAPASQEQAVQEKSVPRETILRVAAVVLILAAIGASVTLLMRTEQAAPAATVAPPSRREAPPAQPTTLSDLRGLADKGDPVAQFVLGARYAQGDEVEQDYSEAVRWFEKAANQGHVVAQATLGAYYWAGRGVPEDLTRAYFWSVLARAGGDEASKYRVVTLASRMTNTQLTQAEQEANQWISQHRGTPQVPLGRSTSKN